jgi:NADPH:quinone reductase-like Zn-dependent oxidoreductase
VAGCTRRVPVNYGDRLADRLRSAANGGRVDAFLDFFGGGYVELAITELGIAPERIDTIIDFPALERFGRFGVKFVGNEDAANAAVPVELAAMIAAGQLEVPIAEVIPLDEVQRAYSILERRHTRGKIVLRP